MMRRARVTGLTLLALAVPAFALGGEQAPSGPASLSVSASLKGCGLASAQVTCQIDASWNALEGAEYYTVSVARPDGVVLDLGQSAGTSRSIFVPYVGAGTYSVQVEAWGTPPGEDVPELVARDRSFSTEDGKVGTHTSGSRANRADGADDGRDADDVSTDPALGQEPIAEPPATERPTCEELSDREESPEEAAATEDEPPPVASETEQYDPADADGDDGCTLEPSP